MFELMSSRDKVEMEAELDLGRSKKFPIAVMGSEEKEIGQKPDRRDIRPRNISSDRIGKDKDTPLTMKHKEVTEQTEVLFNGQGEETSTDAATEGNDVNTAKTQQLSGNEMTDVIKSSDASHRQASGPTADTGKTKAECKSEML